MRSRKKQQEWCAAQVDNPTQNWDNLCQSFARQSYGMGAYGSSAKVACSRGCIVVLDPRI